MRRLLVLGALASSLAACGEETGPVRMMVLGIVPGEDVYELREVELQTLDELHAMKGDAATAIGAAIIDVDPRDFASLPSEQQFRDTVFKDDGSDVQAQFTEQDGVLWPSDFHSLNLATAYYNLERARLYALDRGMDANNGLRGLDLYYFPEFTLRDGGGDGEPLVDNAAFFPLLRSFLVFPFVELQEVPLAMNLGVMAHEYAHGIFNAEVHGDAWIPAYLERWEPDSPGTVLLGCLEEGYADAWGVAVSGDPSFAPHSLMGFVGDSRDVDAFDPGRHCLSETRFLDELAFSRTVGVDAYWGPRQYEVGTIFATLLHDAGNDPRTSQEQVMAALLGSYGSGEESLRAALEADLAADRGGFDLGRLRVPARALVAAADAPTREVLCEVLQDRLSLDENALPLCAGVTPQERCP